MGLQVKKDSKAEVVITLDARKINALHDMLYEFSELEKMDTILSQLVCITMRHVYLFRFSRVLIDPEKPKKMYKLKITTPEAATLVFFLNENYVRSSPYQQTIIRMVLAQIDQLRSSVLPDIHYFF